MKQYCSIVRQDFKAILHFKEMKFQLYLPTCIDGVSHRDLRTIIITIIIVVVILNKIMREKGGGGRERESGGGGRERERDTKTETYRQTDRQSGAQTDRDR